MFISNLQFYCVHMLVYIKHPTNPTPWPYLRVMWTW